MAFGAAIVLVLVLFLATSLSGTTTPVAGSRAASTAGPSVPAATPAVTADPSHPIQQGQNGQPDPGGPSDEVSGAHDVPCPSGDECP
jgi:hypothetical protein